MTEVSRQASEKVKARSFSFVEIYVRYHILERGVQDGRQAQLQALAGL